MFQSGPTRVNMGDTVRRARQVYEQEGLLSLLGSAIQYTSRGITNTWWKYLYQVKYGEIAPRPNEILQVDPEALDYSIWSEFLPSNRPPLGIIDGSWDLQKEHWRETWCDGLRERFEEGKAWEETVYYQEAMERFREGKPVGYFDGPNDPSRFEASLGDIDELYERIQRNGYDPSSIITVYIGRDGEWIVGHGNHRRTIARILGVESIPVRVRYRHKEWQELRRRVYKNESIDDCETTDIHSHPDLACIHST